MVWCLWLDRRGRGEKHCDLCGSLGLTDGIFQSSQLTTMWLTVLSTTHGLRKRRGWWDFVGPILRSKALLRCVCSMAENPYWKWILAPPGTLNLNRTTVFGMSMTLSEKHWEWMANELPSCPRLPHTAIPRALIPFSCKGSWQIIKHKDGDYLKTVTLTLPPQFQKALNYLQIQCPVCGWSQSHQSSDRTLQSKVRWWFLKAELYSHTELVFYPITEK